MTLSFQDFHEFIIGFNIIGHGSLQSKLEWMFDVSSFRSFDSIFE